MSEYVSKLLIIGSGPAGYTAGIYAARAGIEPLLVSGAQVGGQLTMTHSIENFPAFPEGISGPELTTLMRRQAEKNGVRLVIDEITEVDFHHRPFICSSIGGNVYKSQAVIIATGSSARWLDLPSERKYTGFGVSACATCDGFFFKHQNVAVVGGGNSAVQEALYLTNFASRVFLVHRRDTLRANAVLQRRIKNHSKISILWNSVVEEIIGTDEPLGVTGLKIKNVKTDRLTQISVHGVFIAIGHTPNTDVFKNDLTLDRSGYIPTAPASCQTEIEGVFAAGDVCDPEYRQAVIAAGSGAMAAMQAEKYLAQHTEHISLSF